MSIDVFPYTEFETEEALATIKERCAAVAVLEDVRDLLLGNVWIRKELPALSELNNLRTIVRTYNNEHNYENDDDSIASRVAVYDALNTLDKVEALLQGIER